MSMIADVRLLWLAKRERPNVKVQAGKDTWDSLQTSKCSTKYDGLLLLGKSQVTYGRVIPRIRVPYAQAAKHFISQEFRSRTI